LSCPLFSRKIIVLFTSIFLLLLSLLSINIFFLGGGGGGGGRSEGRGGEERMVLGVLVDTCSLLILNPDTSSIICYIGHHVCAPSACFRHVCCLFLKFRRKKKCASHFLYYKEYFCYFGLGKRDITTPIIDWRALQNIESLKKYLQKKKIVKRGRWR
jgi:hypothetical protein